MYISKNLIFLISSFFGIVFLLFFIVNYPSYTHNIFMVVNTWGVLDTPYQDLLHALKLFIVITIIFLFIGRKDYLKLWLIKAFVTLIVMLAYESHYGLDAYMYFAEAVHDFGDSGQGNGATYRIILINRFFTHFVGDSYHALKLFNSLLSFIGLMFIYSTYQYIMKKSLISIENDNFIFILFLFPSILFWSSILGKDPLNLTLVSMYIFAFIRLIDEKKIIYIVIIIASIFLISFIRSWWAIIMLIPMMLYYTKLNSLKSISFVLLLLPIVNIVITSFLQSRGIDSIDQLFITMSTVSQNLSYGKSGIETAEYTGFGSYVMMYIPNTFTAIFRPMFWDVRNPFMLLSAIENILLLYLAYKYVFLHFKIIWTNKYLKFLILFLFSWSLLYSIISPTNLGLAVRFKLQILPSLLVIVFISRAIIKSKFDKL